MRLVRELMSIDVKTVGADWSLEELGRCLTDHSISGAPVVTPAGKVVGVVSVTDLARAVSEQEAAPPEEHDFFARSFQAAVALDDLVDMRLVRESHRKVRDVMTPAVFEVDDGATVGEVAQMMVRGRIHRVFVTRKGAIVGVVSALDLLRLLA